MLTLHEKNSVRVHSEHFLHFFIFFKIVGRSDLFTKLHIYIHRIYLGQDHEGGQGQDLAGGHAQGQGRHLGLGQGMMFHRGVESKFNWTWINLTEQCQVALK